MAYPQALYFPLRSTLQDYKRTQPAYVTVSDIFTYLRRCHPPAYEIDTMVDELFKRANVFTLEEEMLACILANLTRATQQAHALQASAVREAEAEPGRAATREAEVVKAVLAALTKWAAAKLTPSGYVSSSSGSGGGAVAPPPPQHTPSLVHTRAVQRYRRAFMLDFSLQVSAELLAGDGGGGGAAMGVAPSSMADGAEPPSNNPLLPSTLEALIALLRGWKVRLMGAMALRRLSAGSEGNDAMCGPLLAEVGASSDLEVPGQYNSASPLVEPLPGHHVRIAGVEPRLTPTLQLGSSALQRRVVFLGDDGRRYAFILSASSAAITSADARIGQALSVIGALMSRHHAARSRELTLPSWSVVPWSSRLRLTPEAPSTLNLGDAMDKYLEGRAAQLALSGSRSGAANLRCTDDLLTLYRRRLGAHAAAVKKGGGGGEAGGGGGAGTLRASEAAYAAAYADLCAAVPASALQSVLSASMASVEALSALRRSFTTSTAMQSLIARLFSFGDRTPAKLAVALSSGALLASDPRPAYVEARQSSSSNSSSASGAAASSSVAAAAAAASLSASSSHLGALADDAEPVPFRLTRNLVHVVTPQGVCGVLSAAMVAGARGIFCHYELLLAYLALFFRDEAAAFYARSPAMLLSPALQRALREAGAAVGGGGAGADEAAPDAGSVHRRATSNALRLLDRVAELQPPTAAAGSRGEATSLQPQPRQAVYTLLAKAMWDKGNLRMPATWHAWF